MNEKACRMQRQRHRRTYVRKKTPSTCSSGSPCSLATRTPLDTCTSGRVALTKPAVGVDIRCAQLQRLTLTALCKAKSALCVRTRASKGYRRVFGPYYSSTHTWGSILLHLNHENGLVVQLLRGLLPCERACISPCACATV